MIGSCHYKREDSEFSNSVRRPKGLSFEAFNDHSSNSHSISRKKKIEDLPESDNCHVKQIQAMNSIGCPEK